MPSGLGKTKNCYNVNGAGSAAAQKPVTVRSPAPGR